MAALEELDSHLQSLQALKPPGVTKTKITAITQLCLQNVQSDSAIVQQFVQHSRNSPGTHKLGVLYVVDSVVRQWVDKAKAAGQAVSRNAAPGTYASGVQKVTDVLPDLMGDLIKSVPDSQKEKVTKLLDIWERGQIFPLAMVAKFKQQLASIHNDTYAASRSPHIGHSGPHGAGSNANQPVVAPPAPVAAPPAAGSLLAALTSFGQQNTQITAPTNPAPPAVSAFPFLPNVAAPPPGFLPPPPIATNGQAVPPPPLSVNEAMNMILQGLANGALTQEQALPIITSLAQAQTQTQAAPSSAPFVPAPPQLAGAVNIQPLAPNGAQHGRHEQNGDRYRDRSRSPDYGRQRASPERRSPPNRRDSPTYGVYDPNAGTEGGHAPRQQERERGRARGKNRGRNEYRQRTPPGQRRQPSPAGQGSRNAQPKLIEWDSSLPRDHIKVLSRTLFIGGASGTEGEIRNIFNRFGKVQTCIVNQDKRHAFVKMVTRADAVVAKEGMDNITDPLAQAKARQTRWGVGFGPRDCSDYTTGISIIPISRLTEADRKWVVSAEYGGTGGRKLEGGMVLEEPDIEIGAGVSSKAISRRVPPADAGRGRGGAGFGPRGGHDNGPRSRKHDRPPVHEPRHISPRPEPNVAVPPAVPGFGFQLPGMRF